MGRGGYDVTDANKKKSSAAAEVLNWEGRNRKNREDAAAVKANEDAVEKLIRGKKSRGIMAARRAEKKAGARSEPADGGHG
ncbi:hypothetical protein BU25DRAFT_455439 [Macroventuria anomochaeta]|uniref:Uncharacterized protein n=1 Tax=Macroventuria anomochaeta TaxID=301207 RepID=A0ACB6SA67_9PLEO|nr:uncharacterized protein BU25DRAFT_455439 [Macroventuria anomochaeta]KAF2631111.1 hypothetical protein BU25DRAFT_455439 [Macroventuria anomochaeta]